MEQAYLALGCHSQVWSLTEQVSAAAIAPVVGGNQAESFEDFTIQAELDAAAGFGRSDTKRQIIRVDDLECALNAGNFAVEVRAWIECDFRDKVGMQRGCGQHFVGSVQLRSVQCCECARQNYCRSAGRTADVLIGVFRRETEGHFVARMEKNAESWLARPGQARVVIHVDDLRIEQVARQCRDAPAIRRQHAPALAGQELNLAPSHIYPIQTQAWDERAVRHRDAARSAGAQEVKLVVTDKVCALPVAVKTEAEAAVLWAEAIFRELSVYRVIVRNAAEIRADTGAGVLVAPDRRGIQESHWYQTSAAKADECGRWSVRNRFARIGGIGGRLLGRRVQDRRRDHGRRGRRRGDHRSRAGYLSQRFRWKR